MDEVHGAAPAGDDCLDVRGVSGSRRGLYGCCLLPPRCLRFIFRAQLRAWWIRRKLKSLSVPAGSSRAAACLRPGFTNSTRCSVRSARTRRIRAHSMRNAQFIEAAETARRARRFARGRAAICRRQQLVAVQRGAGGAGKRAGWDEAIERVLAQCEHYLALDHVFRARISVRHRTACCRSARRSSAPRTGGSKVAGCRIFFATISRDARSAATLRPSERRCATRGRFAARKSSGGFWQCVTHPFAATLIEELDDTEPPLAADAAPNAVAVLTPVGRFWAARSDADILVEPDGWRKALSRSPKRRCGQNPPRSLLVSGEPLVGKSSFLRLLASGSRRAAGACSRRAAPICKRVRSISVSSKAASARSSTNWPRRLQDDLVHPRHRAAGDERHAIRARARPCSTRSFRRSPPAAS